jgi:hypothetical protein
LNESLKASGSGLIPAAVCFDGPDKTPLNFTVDKLHLFSLCIFLSVGNFIHRGGHAYRVCQDHGKLQLS